MRAGIPTMTADQLIERCRRAVAVLGPSAGCAMSIPTTTSTGTCSASSATSCAGPEAAQLGLPTARPGSVSGTATAPTAQRCRRQPPAPRYTSRCGLGRPDRLRLVEGISVGYGDDYAANLEGQSLRLTGLAAGRYVLVHRVNTRQRLREIDYSNNAASLLLRLRWRAGVPRVRVLGRCPDTGRCLMSQ